MNASLPNYQQFNKYYEKHGKIFPLNFNSLCSQ